VYPEPEEILEEHRRLLDAIVEGDEERLLALIESHMVDTVARINAERGAAPVPEPDAGV
jgi:DNA-binding GntR family transcriptional regulator